MYKVSNFTDTPRLFPRHDIDPKEKNTKEWTLKFLQAIYAEYLLGRTSIGYDQMEQMKELRMYGAGKQSNERYKNQLLGSKKKDGTRKAWANINWDIFAPWPKFKNVVLGMMESLDHEIIPNAVDPVSRTEKEDIKWGIWFQRNHEEVIAQANQAMGINEEPPLFTPETLDELELFDEMGGFKIKAEVSLEKIIKATEHISDGHVLKRKIIEDLIDLNKAAARTVFDKRDGKVKYEYADPFNCGMQYSRKFDYNNSEYAYEFVNYEIGDIRKMFPDIKEHELQGLAKNYESYLNNTTSGSFDRYNVEIDGGRFGYDNFRVPVMHGWYRTQDTRYTKRKNNKYGEERYYREPYGTEAKKEGEEIIKTPVEMIYEGTWIVGTEYVCNYGPMKDIIRPQSNSTEFPIKMYQLPGKSLTETVIPLLDAVCLNHYRFQDAIATSPKPGLAIEFSSLENIALGKDTLPPLEVLKIRRQTGDLLYKATTHHSKPGNSGKPVHEIQGGLGNQLREFIDIFEYNFEMIRNLTGINRLADGSAPQASDQVGTSNLAIVGTENALKPIYLGYLYIKEKLTENAVLRIQSKIKSTKKTYEAYLPIIGKANLEVIKIGEDDISRTYGFTLRAKATAQVVNAIRTAAFEAMKPGKNGNSALTMGDYMFIEQELDKGNIKYAQAVINHKIKKAIERDEELARQNQERQGQLQQELEMVKEQNAQKEHKRKLELLNTEWDRRDAHEVAKANGTIAQKIAENEMAPEGELNNIQ
jgi:hypothetical protein